MNKMQNLFQMAFSIIAIFFVGNLSAQVNFDEYFLPKTLRLDYIHAGNSTSESINLEQLKEEPFWSGNPKNLLDPFGYGGYRLSVFDSASRKMIYSTSFATLFLEWQSTEEAKLVNRSFYETVTFPFPKKTVLVEIYHKDKKNKMLKVFDYYVNPTNYFIKKEKPKKAEFAKVLYSGLPEKKLDIVFLPEGYTKEEMEKFHKDVNKFTTYLFNYEPYKELKEKINVWSVDAISEESGTDIPGENIWKNTALNSSFYTFGTERYLTTFDVKSFRDYAANVPYDQIVILTNTKKYGGGGFYNLYSLFSSDNEYSELVFIHEIGHGFTGLADEYYTSDVAFQDFYDLTVEPAEPNITTLVDFASKWKNMVDKDTPIPTPNDNKYKSSVGAFEGGGYVAKGIYRPKASCMMKEYNSKKYCPVCLKAVREMILHFAD